MSPAAPPRPTFRRRPSGFPCRRRKPICRQGRPATMRMELCGWGPNSPRTEARRKPAATADSAGPAIWIGPTASHQLGHGTVFVERSSAGDCLRQGKRGRSCCPVAKRESPLAAGPQCRHGLLPAQRNGPVDRWDDHPRRQASLCGGRRSDPQLRRDRRHFQAAGCSSGVGGPGVGPADRTKRCHVGGRAAYFDVQQARGNLAGVLDTAGKAEVLVRKTAGLARLLVPEVEVARARALLYDLRQEVTMSRANWRIASSRLTQILRLNPGAVVVPMEPPHLQVTLISPRLGAAELIPVGLASRPELASQQALVQASCERVRQEQLRPLIPSVVVEGGSGPGNALTGGVFGGGADNGPQLYGGRFDMGVGVVWTLNNLARETGRWSARGSPKNSSSRSNSLIFKTGWPRRWSKPMPNWRRRRPRSRRRGRGEGSYRHL